MLTSTYWSTVFLFCFDNVRATIINATETQILNEILDESIYDASVRAVGEMDSSNSTALEIQAQILVRYINYFDDLKQEVGFQIVLRLWWPDARHNYEHLFQDTPEKAAQVPKYVQTGDASRIWYPDIFILNGKSAYIHNVLKPNMMVRIYKNGTTYFSTRLTAAFYCPMNLQWYPFDKHACPFRFKLYSLNEIDAYLVWHPSGSLRNIMKDEQIPMFELERIYESNHTVTKYNSLQVTLEFKRRISFYITKVYFPFFLLVFVSMSVFWLERMDARLTLGITTILATATQMNGLGVSDPAVAYIKALDIYTSVCQWFVTAAFLESAIVSTMIKKYGNRTKFEATLTTAGPPNKSNWILSMKPVGTLLNAEQEQPRLIMTIWTNLKSWNCNEVEGGRRQACRVDRIARIVFPIAFVIFVSTYFFICLSHDHD